MSKTYITEILDAEDGSGDGILTFPPELIGELGWKEGNTLKLEVVDDVLIIKNKDITEKEVIVEKYVAEKQQNEDSA